ncbi:MAG: hypothetical protein ACYC64_10385 [Armatimonadota bacterium]
MSDTTLQNAACEYLAHLKEQGKTDRTLYTYGMDLKQIESYFGPDKKLGSILIPHVSGFLKSDALLKMRGDKDRSQITVKKTVRVFRMFLIWAKDRGYITKLPLPKDISAGRAPAAVNAEPDPAPTAED